jgi:hypothetical protein
MMWDFNQAYFEGKLILSDQAWRRLEEWRVGGKEIGVWYVAAKSGSVRTLGTVESARDGCVELRGSTVRADFNLRNATFAYSPMQLFSRWPMGPMVKVMALQAFLETGAWLMLAEGLRPESLPTRGLAQAG